ncbi:MAG: IS1182 family transposase [Candidatus Hydrothermarchaeaceae archaeon]
MMGQKVFQEKYFYNFSLSRRIPEGHILRRLSKVVDLSFVRKLTASFYSHTGQPSIDPVVLFKMMLLGYLYGITSERKLAEECNLNLAFMWYLGYDVDEATPDHSVISKARSRYGRETFEKFFERILELCIKAELVNGEEVFADSTLIRANASLESMVPRSEVFEPPRSPKEHVDQVFVENPVPTEVEGETDSTERAPQGSDPEDGIEQPPVVKLSEGGQTNESEELAAPGLPRKRGRPPKPRKAYNELRISKTDPDASVVSRPMIGKGLFYKQHFTVDSSRVITAVSVTSGIVEDHTQVRGLLDKQPIAPKRFSADSHYGVPGVYGELKRRGILPAIPRRSPQARKPRPGHLPPSAFRYDRERDVYICPQDKPLRRVAFDPRYQRYHYRPRDPDCRGCPLRKACSTEKTVRNVFRYKEEDALEWGMAHLETREAEELLIERRVLAEGVVGEAKTQHGLRRAICRGLDKVTIQALLTASVQNLKRLLKTQTNMMERATSFILLCLPLPHPSPALN